MPRFIRWSLRILMFLLGVLGLAIILLGLIYLVVNKTNGKIEVAGEQRRYLLYVPDSYDSTKPAPLVISIHGFAEWPAHQMEISDWNDLADRYGFLVVYPSGTGFPLRWRTSGQAEGDDDPLIDVQFIDALISKLQNSYNIDPKRIFANGLSNGGGMSHLLACKLSGRIAAIGSVAGAYTLPAEECTPDRPVPVIAFHGTADPIVPYNGSGSTHNGFTLQDISTWVDEWASRNGCQMMPEKLPASGEVSGVQYVMCNQNADVIFYTIQGGGHSWPGGGYLPKFIVGHTTQDIDATQVMWEFFEGRE